MNFRKRFHLLPGPSSGHILCTDLSADAIKIAHVRPSANNKEVADLFVHEVRQAQEADISKLIRSAVADMALKNPYVMDIIPSPLVITRNIEVPSRDPSEIDEIINLQASRLTPYAREDIIIDYVNIGVYRKSYTKLLLITVARSLIKKHLDVLLNAGLRADRVCFSAEGITHAIWRALKLSADEPLVNILHVDGNFTDFIVSLKEKVIFVRGIPIGMEHLIAGKEQHQLRFVEEVKKSLEAYAAEDIERMPSRIILTRTAEKIKDLDNLLSATLHIPVTNMPYLKEMPLSQKASAAFSGANLNSFLSVIAPAFVLEELKLNLIPEEIKFKKMLEEKGRDIVKAGILVMTLFILICATLISNVYFKSAYLKNLSSQYVVKHEQAQKLEKDFSRVQAVRNYIMRRGYSLGILDELFTIVTPAVALGDIRFDAQGKFSMKGSAESMSAVFALIDDMGKSKYFKDVKTKYTTKRKEGDRDVVDFEIISLLEEAKS